MDHNYRFKLSYLMPTFWFYKLRDMGNSTKQSSTITSQSTKNKQVLNTTNFHEQPRKSTKQRANRRASNRTSSPIQLGFHDIARKDDKLGGGGYDASFSNLVLPPIVTKTSTKFNDFLSDDAKNNNNNKETKPRRGIVTNKDKQQGEFGFIVVNYVNRRMDDLASELMTLDPSNGSRHKYDRSESKSIRRSLKVKIRKENNASMEEVKNSPSGSRRLRLKISSPRVRSRKSVSSVAATTGGRRSLSDSFAIVKSSLNPRRDFRESMVEMIVHNNMRSSKDMEDLLACYLSLNSDEYHDLIIKAFKQISFDLSHN